MEGENQSYQRIGWKFNFSVKKMYSFEKVAKKCVRWKKYQEFEEIQNQEYTY